MVAPVPVRKIIEIRDALSIYIDGAEIISEFDVKRFQREIKKLPSIAEQDELIAFLFAAQGMINEAIRQFEYAIDCHSEFSTICNYCIFLKRTRRWFEAKKAYCLYHRWFDDSILLNTAVHFLGLAGDEQGVDICTKKLIGIFGAESEEGKEVMNIQDGLLNLYQAAQEKSGLTKDDINDLTDIALKVMSPFRLPNTNSNFVFAESTFAFVVSVETADSDLLSDLNINASFALADNDRLAEKNVSVVFKNF